MRYIEIRMAGDTSEHYAQTSSCTLRRFACGGVGDSPRSLWLHDSRKLLTTHDSWAAAALALSIPRRLGSSLVPSYAPRTPCHPPLYPTPASSAAFSLDASLLCTLPATQPRCQLLPRPARGVACAPDGQQHVTSASAASHPVGVASPHPATHGRAPCMPSHTESVEASINPLFVAAPHTHLEGRRPCCPPTVRRTQKSCARGAALLLRSLPTASLASLANIGSLASLAPLAGDTLNPVLR